MEISKPIICLIFIFLGTGVHAASFECTKASSSTEKIICGSKDLSLLDSKLSRLYQTVYGAADPIAKDNLLRAQRSWVRYVRLGCEDEECITVAYEDQIDQLEDIQKGAFKGDLSKKRRNLEFNGLQFGQVLDNQMARAAFSRFECDSKNEKEQSKLLSSIEHHAVVSCEGETIFEHQKWGATIELHGDHRLVNITMCYDTPYPLEGVNSTSVDEMEDRLIATYGQPDVLRPESKHQPVQYDPKDLLPGNSLDQGSDLWIFAHGASISMGWCAGHQKDPGGHIFDAESITFSDDSVRTSVTLPAHHPIPIIWSKLSESSGSVPSWRPDELMSVMVYAGGKRTCTIGNPVPSVTDDRGTRFSSTMVCTDFIEIGYSPIAAGAPTRIHVLRNNQVLAVGYIPETQAVASLEVH